MEMWLLQVVIPVEVDFSMPKMRTKKEETGLASWTSCSPPLDMLLVLEMSGDSLTRLMLMEEVYISFCSDCYDSPTGKICCNPEPNR